MTKPFSAREALAHIHAVLRRVALDQIGLQARPIQHGIFNLDPAAHRAVKGQLELNLYAREFDLLNVLIDHAGRVISRAKSMAHVWGNQWIGDPHILDVHIRWLRLKIKDDPDQPR